MVQLLIDSIVGPKLRQAENNWENKVDMSQHINISGYVCANSKTNANLDHAAPALPSPSKCRATYRSSQSEQIWTNTLGTPQPR